MGSAKSTSFCISLKVFTNINEKCLNAEKNQQIFFSPETVGAGADFFWESGGGGVGLRNIRSAFQGFDPT